jgi:hypothetical protein
VAGSVAAVRALLGQVATLGEVALIGLVVPVAILAVGAPVALVVGLAVEAIRLFWFHS